MLSNNYNTPEIREKFLKLRENYTLVDLASYTGWNQSTLRKLQKRHNNGEFSAISKNVAEDVTYAYEQMIKNDGRLSFLDNEKQRLYTRAKDAVNHLLAYSPKTKASATLNISIETLNRILSTPDRVSTPKLNRVIATYESLDESAFTNQHRRATGMALPKFIVSSEVSKVLYKLRDKYLNGSSDIPVIKFLSDLLYADVPDDLSVLSQELNLNDPDTALSIAYFLSHRDYHIAIGE